MSKNIGYLETKLARTISVLITANKYKNDLSKFAEFVSANKTYFPDIDNEFLELIKKGYPVVFIDDPEHKERIPVFAELNYELKNNKG